jgi:hypothetical protein
MNYVQSSSRFANDVLKFHLSNDVPDYMELLSKDDNQSIVIINNDNNNGKQEYVIDIHTIVCGINRIIDMPMSIHKEERKRILDAIDKQDFDICVEQDVDTIIQIGLIGRIFLSYYNNYTEEQKDYMYNLFGMFWNGQINIGTIIDKQDYSQCFDNYYIKLKSKYNNVDIIINQESIWNGIKILTNEKIELMNEENQKRILDAINCNCLDKLKYEDVKMLNLIACKKRILLSFEEWNIDILEDEDMIMIVEYGIFGLTNKFNMFEHL